LESTRPIVAIEPAVPVPAAGVAPWHCFVAAFGATSIIVGAIWDISWHTTVGRDTFWTAAHMAIYLGGVLGGLTGGWLIFEATILRRAALRGSGVRVWGLRGPLGAWILVWGACTMIVSAPFDDWWHFAYGLDVEILSPPHTVLAAGVLMVGVGALLLTLGVQNRAIAAGEKGSAFLAAYTCGVLLTMAAVFLTEMSYPNLQRTGQFYRASCMTYPLYLAVAARSSRFRWPATTAAATYMIVNLLMAWILPLFPAEPLLGPIYNRLDHMAPPPFPLVLVAPALVIDFLVRSFGSRLERPGVPGMLRDGLLALLLGTAFLAVFLLVQWNFASFLISPAADNAVFVGNRFYAYFNQLGDWRWYFWRLQVDPVTPEALAWAWSFSVAASQVGLWLGSWLARVKR
jgi:hypothetical protein